MKKMVSLLILWVSMFYWSSSAAQTPVDMYIYRDENPNLSERINHMKIKKNFDFKYLDEIYITYTSISLSDLGICNKKTKEWQKNFGTGAKDKKPSYDDFDYSVFANNYPCKFVVEQLARQLINQSNDLDYNAEEKINFLISFVNSLPYEKEASTADHWKTPYETLDDGKGDCEDHAFLLAELISLAGFDTLIAEFPTHVGVCTNPKGNVNTRDMSKWVVDGTSYYYCESTPKTKDGSECWKLGDLPPEVQKLGPPTSTRLLRGQVIVEPSTTYKPENEPRVN